VTSSNADKAIVAKYAPCFIQHLNGRVIASDSAINKFFLSSTLSADFNSFKESGSGCGGTRCFPDFAVCARMFSYRVGSEASGMRRIYGWHGIDKSFSHARLSGCIHHKITAPP
jgi:hypothetical protein